MVPALPHGVRVLFLLALVPACLVGDESAGSGGETDVGVTGPNERPIPTNSGFAGSVLVTVSLSRARRSSRAPAMPSTSRLWVESAYEDVR